LETTKAAKSAPPNKVTTLLLDTLPAFFFEVLLLAGLEVPLGGLVPVVLGVAEAVVAEPPTLFSWI